MGSKLVSNLHAIRKLCLPTTPKSCMNCFRGEGTSTKGARAKGHFCAYSTSGAHMWCSHVFHHPAAARKWSVRSGYIDEQHATARHGLSYCTHVSSTWRYESRVILSIPLQWELWRVIISKAHLDQHVDASNMLYTMKPTG